MQFDPIADMFTRIKNSYLANKKEVVVAFSKQKQQLAKVLVAQGYLAGVSVKGKKIQEKQLLMKLSYNQKGQPALVQIKRISKPSRRYYVKATKIPVVLSGYGIAILSTNKGFMTDKQARQKKIGGEIICEIT